MAENITHMGYHDVVGIGFCSKCNVIFKQRADDKPQNGVYRCRQCGAVVNFKKMGSSRATGQA